MLCSAAELKTTTLETTLSQYDSINPDLASHIRREEQVREQYTQAKVRLDEFEKALSSPSTDVQTLTTKLREKEAALDALRIKQQQDEKVCVLATDENASLMNERYSQPRPYMPKLTDFLLHGKHSSARTRVKYLTSLQWRKRLSKLPPRFEKTVILIFISHAKSSHTESQGG